MTVAEFGRQETIDILGVRGSATICTRLHLVTYLVTGKSKASRCDVRSQVQLATTCDGLAVFILQERTRWYFRLCSDLG